MIEISQVSLPNGFITFGPNKVLITRFKKVDHSPLTAEEANCCLGSLIPKIFVVLNKLHGTLEIAHLDVKLENICYSGNVTGSMKAVLIDLDRWEPADSPARLLHTRYPGSVMYEKLQNLTRAEWKMKCTDFKQFGK